MPSVPPYQDISHLTQNLCISERTVEASQFTPAQIEEVGDLIGDELPWKVFAAFCQRYHVVKANILRCDDRESALALCKTQDRVWGLIHDFPSPLSFVCAYRAWSRAKRGGTKAAAPDHKLGKIYFIEAGGFVKIGFSKNTRTRLGTLQTATPFALKIIRTVPGTVDDERAFHKQFSHLSERGEWFKATPELLTFIKELRAK